MDITKPNTPFHSHPPRVQIASKDKDFRYMATSDLQGELAKDGFKTDGETEKKLCHVILQQLDDISGDISGLAVKWWVP